MILGGDKIEGRDGFALLSDILYIFCTMFVMIVMLNLLISIISEIFSSVQQNSINEYYQEKASIIAENRYLILDEAKDEEVIKPG